jgi:hypothetical protein
MPQKVVLDTLYGTEGVGDYNIQTSKFFFWAVFFYELLTPKLMKIKWSFILLGTFAPHFQITLNTHGLNLNSIFAIKSKLKFFC